MTEPEQHRRTQIAPMVCPTEPHKKSNFSSSSRAIQNDLDSTTTDSGSESVWRHRGGENFNRVQLGRFSTDVKTVPATHQTAAGRPSTRPKRPKWNRPGDVPGPARGSRTPYNPQTTPSSSGKTRTFEFWPHGQLNWQGGPTCKPATKKSFGQDEEDRFQENL